MWCFFSIEFGRLHSSFLKMVYAIMLEKQLKANKRMNDNAYGGLLLGTKLTVHLLSCEICHYPWRQRI